MLSFVRAFVRLIMFVILGFFSTPKIQISFYHFIRGFKFCPVKFGIVLLICCFYFSKC